ncbi:MAG TPA: hypothetical protein LFW21_01430 [Rickettsia endosymbiont of Pyrocoelia pectoralis]|nr:hypothetical protein [Rickettsia endosymbiont of Pyrocoelia pectoralis]
MLGFIRLASAIKVLYQYTKNEILEQDFFDLSAKDYLKIPAEDRGRKWYMLNPSKLNNKHINDPAAFIVDEDEKYYILQAISFVKETSASLSTDASYLERLLYTKKFIPSCLFSSEEKEENTASSVTYIETVQKNKITSKE